MSYYARTVRPGTRALQELGRVKLVPTGRWALAVLCTFFLEVAAFISPAASRELPSPKNVLVLNSFTGRNTVPELEPLKDAVRAHLSIPVDFNVEYLESIRLNDDGYRRSLGETLRTAYSKPKPDLIVVIAYPALRFMLDYRQHMFPGVPIVFVGVDPHRLRGQEVWSGVTGVTSATDVRGSVNLALRFHPDTENVVLLSGVSEFETYWMNRFREEALLDRENLKSFEIAGLSPRAALDQASALPPRTIVFA